MLGKNSYYHQNIVPNLQVESSATHLLTIDEVEKVQRQRVANFTEHVFQLTYAAILGLQPRDKAAMLVVCWWSIQLDFLSKNLH